MQNIKDEKRIKKMKPSPPNTKRTYEKIMIKMIRMRRKSYIQKENPLKCYIRITLGTQMMPHWRNIYPNLQDGYRKIALLSFTCEFSMKYFIINIEGFLNHII